MTASWPETKPLSEENLSDLVDRITQAESNIETGKTVIAGAISDMNQPASPTDTHAQMAQKIRDISKDADAAVGNVLSGKTFYQGGQKRTGTMPNRGAVTITPGQTEQTILSGYHNGQGKVMPVNFDASKVLTGTTIAGKTGTMPNRTGHVTAQSISRSGTTLRLRPPNGHYPGDAANSVQASDPDFVAGNIRKGVDIFGVTGTYAGHIIKSINRGTLTITSDNTYEVPLPSSANKSKCVPRVSFTASGQIASSDARNYFVEAFIEENFLKISIGHYLNTPIAVEWEVVEYGDDVIVQSGDYSNTLTTDTVVQAITPVELTKSQLVFNYRWGYSAANNVSRGFIKGRFVNNHSIEFKASQTGNFLLIRWYIITFP